MSMFLSPFLLPPIIFKNVVIPGLVARFYTRLPPGIRFHFAIKFCLLLLHSNIISFIDLGNYNLYLVRSAYGVGAFACIGIVLFLHRFFTVARKWPLLFAIPTVAFGFLSFSPWVVAGMDGRNSIAGPLLLYFLLAPSFTFSAYMVMLIPNYWHSRGIERHQKGWILASYLLAVPLILSTNVGYPLLTGRSDLSGFGAYWILIPALVTMWIIISSRTGDLSIKDDKERAAIEATGISELDFAQLGHQIIEDYRELASSGGGFRINQTNQAVEARISLLTPDAVVEAAHGGPIAVGPDSLTSLHVAKPNLIPANRPSPRITFFELLPNGDRASTRPVHFSGPGHLWSIDDKEFIFSTRANPESTLTARVICPPSGNEEILEIELAVFASSPFLPPGHYKAEIELC